MVQCSILTTLHAAVVTASTLPDWFGMFEPIWQNVDDWSGAPLAFAG